MGLGRFPVWRGNSHHAHKWFRGIRAQVRATWSGPAPAVGAVVCHTVVKPKHQLNTVLLGVVGRHCLGEM